MSAAPHLLLPFKRTRRYVGRLTFLLFAGLAGGSYWIFTHDVEREVFFPFAVTLLVGLLASDLPLLLKPVLRAGDGLRLDAGGLAFSRAGNYAQWRWDEISDLRIRSRLHPASLFLGRFMTFRVPADGRRGDFGFRGDRVFLRGGTLAIGDDYASRLEDIRDQIDYFRDRAGPEKRRSGGGAAPEPVWTARKDRKQPKFWHSASLVLGPAAGVGLGSLIVDGLPEGFGLLEAIESLYPATIGLAFGAPWLVIMMLKQESVQDNMLSMSAGGLAVQRRDEKRRWLWSEIIDIKVGESASRGEDGAAARIIGFRALHDGSESGRAAYREKPSTPVSCSIEDHYETPVEDVARQARLWLDWTGGTFGLSAAGTAIDSESGAAGLAAGLAYRRSPGVINTDRSVLEGLLPLVMLTPMAAAAGLSVWALKSDGGSWLAWLPWWGMIIGFLLIVFVPLIGALTLVDPSLNRLDLSEEALDMARMGRTSRWAWSDVGAVEMRRVRTKWSAKQRTVLVLEVPATRWGSRYLRWAHNLGGEQPLAVIEDSYDTPLEEIQAALDDYRRRHGGRRPPRAAE